MVSAAADRSAEARATSRASRTSSRFRALRRLAGPVILYSAARALAPCRSFGSSLPRLGGAFASPSFCSCPCHRLTQEPDGIADDLGRKAVVGIAGAGGRRHPTQLSGTDHLGKRQPGDAVEHAPRSCEPAVHPSRGERTVLTLHPLHSAACCPPHLDGAYCAATAARLHRRRYHDGEDIRHQQRGQGRRAFGAGEVRRGYRTSGGRLGLGAAHLRGGEQSVQRLGNRLPLPIEGLIRERARTAGRSRSRAPRL